MFSLGYEKANLDDDDEDFFLYGPNMAHDSRLAGLRSQVNDVTRYQTNKLSVKDFWNGVYLFSHK